MKTNWYNIIGIALVVITTIVNVVSYFLLPPTINTKFSLTGGTVNSMPTYLYLIISLAIVSIFVFRTFSKEADQRTKVKGILISAVIAILNIVLIAVQL